MGNKVPPVNTALLSWLICSIICDSNLVKTFVNNPTAYLYYIYCVYHIYYKNVLFLDSILSERAHPDEQEEGTMDGGIRSRSYEVAAHLIYLIL